MTLKEFYNNNKQPFWAGLVFITEIASQAIGWLNFIQEFIISSPYCTYFLIGNSMCPLFFDGFTNSERSYEYCYQFNDGCDSAKEIRDIFIAGLCLPLCLSVLFMLFLLLVYFKQYHKIQLWVTIIWIIASLTSVGLYIYNSIRTQQFADESNFQVNLNIRDCSIIILSIRFLQIIFLIIFSYCYYQGNIYKVAPTFDNIGEKQDTYLTGTAEPIDLNLEIR